MRLSYESRRWRVAVLVPLWIVLAALLAGHARGVRDYLAVSGSLGLRGSPEATTPLGATYPGFASDAQTWVRHALALLEGRDIRLRHTTIDNAPWGREVHWNSAWAWAIAGAGKLDHWVNGTPLPRAVERMTIWLPPFTLFVAMVGFSWWVAQRAGLLAGVFVAFALVGHNRLYEGFFPSYVDHHGLISASILALMLGAFFMGAGWWRESGPAGTGHWPLPTSLASARSAAVFSGLGGACGLWFGAASIIPPIAFVGLAGLLTVLLRGRQALAAGDRFDPECWRLWGRSGAAGSLLFYLLEYFPNHLGLRLEVNHPFHALAWLGAGELIAVACAWWLGGARRETIPWRRVGLALGAVTVSPLTILVGRTRVFTVIDPFLAELHNAHIQEFLPLARTLNRLTWKPLLEVTVIENLPMIVGALALLTVARRFLLIWFGVMITAFSAGLALWQSRWLLNVTGPQIALAVVLLAALLGNRGHLTRWASVLVLTLGLFGFPSVRRITATQEDVAERRVSPADALPALFRDIARVIRASQPEGDVVLVSSPNSSTGIGYFGRFKTLGTLYWENNEGLKAAGRILAAPNAAEAERLIRERKVTHLAIVSEENFVAPYYQLLNPGAPLEAVKGCFGYQLLVDKVVPFWLRTIPYRVPDDLKDLKVDVLLMQVAFGQTPADALYHIALTKIEMGDLDLALKDLDELCRTVPAAPQPWLRKAEILTSRQAWAEGAQALIEGIRRAKAEEQMDLYAAAAANFYRQQRPAEAVAVYRAALATAFEPNMASYLGWVLSTTSDDRLRNGKEALEWARRAVEADPNSPTFLNTLAAALAENGRFAEAAAAGEKALLQAQALNDAQAVTVSQSRLAEYRAGRPWRE